MSNEKQRLDKILSNNGFGSRNDVKRLIRTGSVKVNDITVTQADIHTDISAKITVNGKELNYKKHIYIIMNKPSGVLSASKDEKEQTVIDLLPEELKRKNLFPAGRLDKDTEGLLIITDDGELAHNMLSPKKHIPKTYNAEVLGEVNNDDVLAFEKGIDLDDFFTMPAQLKILTAGQVSKIELTIHEGKFHQVKRMFNKRDKEVIFLKRIKMGDLKLDENLEKGQARELTDDEVKKLIKN